MTQRKPTGWMLFVLLIVLILSACAPALPAATATPESQALPPQDTPIIAPEGVETEESGQAAAPTLVAVKSALEATDPGSVSLVSGGPLLVEFFAFW
jgi:hypothetical protein